VFLQIKIDTMKFFLFTMTLLMITFISCKKEEVSLPISTTKHESVNFNKGAFGFNLLILDDNLNLLNADAIVAGKVDTFRYNSEVARSFDFWDYTIAGTNEFKFVMQIPNGPSYNLQVLESKIEIGKKYQGLFNTMNFANDSIKYASNTTITFTKYEYPGRIEGNFVSYVNNDVWCRGNFGFTAMNTHSNN